jgi:hypothetical protein
MTSLLRRMWAKLRAYLEEERRCREEREAQCRHDGEGPRCCACIVLAHIFD